MPSNYIVQLTKRVFLTFCYNSQLKRDLKMTNIEEMQIQTDIYYQEVCLQCLAEKGYLMLLTNFARIQLQ